MCLSLLRKGLRLPLGMETLGSSKNAVPEEAGAPESWELADLEESMRTLMAASSKRLPGSHAEVCDIVVGNPEVDGSLIPLNSAGAVKSGDDVDGFLREALQNPRDRLTILRLEQEVERFMRNPKVQQLEFQPMPSSYLRLAAHRVAQHYFLQSMVVDSGSVEGSRIVARKTADNRYPPIRLADIPVGTHTEEKTVSLLPAKLAIKQRPSKGGRANGDASGGSGLNRLLSAKSVEERKEEYNRARARIFSNDLSGKVGELEIVSVDDDRGVDCYSVEDVLKVEEKFKADVQVEPPERTSPVRVLPDFSLSEGRNRDYTEKESFSRSKTNSNSRVAIFRDREKDRKDPDYDRNYDRYSQRFEPGFGMGVGGPFAMQAIYTPLVNYNTEFPQLAGHRPQMHMEPPPPPPIPQQRVQRVPPWGNPGPGNLSFRPPDPPVAPFTPGYIGPHSAMAMYMHAPQYAYPGPSMAYMHPHDRFQQSLSQTHPQQPDASFNRAQRR